MTETEPVRMCGKGLHFLTADNLTPAGRCRPCRRASQRRWVADYRRGGLPAPTPISPEVAEAAVQATVTPGEQAAATAALVDALESTAWAFAAAVQGGKPEEVERIVATTRMDVIAVILASQLPRPPRIGRNGKTVECGTNLGYAEHIRRGEPTCVSCRAAHARVNAGYRTRATDEQEASVRKASIDALHRRDTAGRVVA